MSDMAGDFRAHKEWARERKEKRYQESSSAREEIWREALDVGSKNGGQHLVVRTAKDTIDFWPSTGRWVVRGKKAQGYDARSLLKRMKQ